MADAQTRKLHIVVKTIPHSEQRYPTCGDYWDDPDGTQHIRVSDMHNVEYEFLVAFHELIEKELARIRGISEQAISKFDIMYEQERAEGHHGKGDEPGMDSRAPYHKEHLFATQLEMALAKEMGVEWSTYNQAVENLDGIG